MRKLKTALLASALAFASTGAAAIAAEPVPLEYFAIREAVQSVAVSPDGEHIAFLKNESREGNPLVVIYRTDDFSEPLKTLNADPMEFTSLTWISNDNLILSARDMIRRRIEGYNQGVYAYKTVGYDLDTGDFTEFGANTSIANLLPDEPDKVLIERSRTNANNMADDPFAAFRPRAYYELNLENGARSLVLKGNTEVASAGFDDEGNPRFAQGFDAAKNEVIYYYRKPGDNSWTEMFRVGDRDQFYNTVEFAGINPDDPSTVYVIANRGEDLTGLYEFDTDMGEFGTLLYRDDKADVLSPIYTPNQWGEKQRLVGVRVTGAKAEPVWFMDRPQAAETRALYENLEAAIPNAHSIQIISMSADSSTFTVRNSGPRDPGTYYLVKDGALQLIGSENPLLKPEDLSDVEYITYKARDGRDIPAYVTIPNEGEAPYPLVVLPHGGPYITEIIGYDEWAQMLANNGYMVLQPQYRGSTGYGVDHFMSSWDQHGRAMQDDKDDGALHLVREGLADPERIAMFGWSYGGYAALVTASREPQIYQCTIAGAAVADPMMQYNYRRGEPGTFSNAFGRQRATGVIPIDEVENINIPVLMIHGDVDQRVPYDHYRKYKPAVEKANKKAEFLTLEKADHFYNTLTYQHQYDLYESILEFLDEDCGPGGL